MTKLPGKIALVTGASRGLGRAIAQRLAADGALVAIHYGGNEAAAKETLEAIEQAGGNAFLTQAELGVNGDVDKLFTKLEQWLAGRPLDIVVNNAAVSNPEAMIANTTLAEYERIFAREGAVLHHPTRLAAHTRWRAHHQHFVRGDLVCHLGNRLLDDQGCAQCDEPFLGKFTR